MTRLLTVLCIALAATLPPEAELWLFRVRLNDWLDGRGPFPERVSFAKPGPADDPGNGLFQGVVAKLDHKLTEKTINELARMVATYPDEMRGWAVLGQFLEEAGKTEHARRAYARMVDLLVKHICAAPGSAGALISRDVSVQAWQDAEKEVLVWAEREVMDERIRHEFDRVEAELRTQPHTYQEVLEQLAVTGMDTGFTMGMCRQYREAQRNQARFISEVLTGAHNTSTTVRLATGFADFFLEAGDVEDATRAIGSLIDTEDFRSLALPWVTAVVPNTPVPQRAAPELFRMEVERLLELGQEPAARAFYAAQRARYPADASVLAELDHQLVGRPAAPAGPLARALAASRAGRLAESLALLREARAAHQPLPSLDELEVLCRPVWRDDAGQAEPHARAGDLLGDPGPTGDAEHRYWNLLVSGKRADADAVCARELERAPLGTVWILARTWHLWLAGDQTALDAWLARARAAVRYTGGRVWLLEELAHLPPLRPGTGVRYDGGR